MDQNTKNQTRHFNELFFSGKWVTKKSSYVEKFHDEISWIVSVPEKLKNYVPEVKNYSINHPMFIKYEKINFPTVHSLFMDEKTTEENWNEVIKQYRKLINAFKKHRPANFNEEAWRNATIQMYVSKTIDRLSSIEKSGLFHQYFKDKTVNINNHVYHSGSTIIDFLKEQKKLLLANSNSHPLFGKICNPTKENICLFHGDLCFSNVFVNIKKNQIKIIDPRGSFGEFKQYGDMLFELSKITESIFGLYDFIIEDKFEVKFENKNVCFDIHINKNTCAMQDQFQSFFPKKNFNLVRLIEALQFLSMIPFHSDSIKRQNAFLIIGIILFNEVVF